MYSTTYSQQLYTCASSVKASIKTVELQLNGTHGFGNLSVSQIRDRVYDDMTPEPIWGVERVEPATGLTIDDVDVLWGLVGPADTDNTFIETRQAREMYLPATSWSNDVDFRDTLAAPTVFTAAWNSVYRFASYIAGTSIQGLPSYSGETQYALFLKWRELSHSPDGASRILNLIWTDVVASSVVGRKTGFASLDNLEGGYDSASNSRMVRAHRNVILYGNILFAIPALIAAGLWVAGFVVAVCFLLSRTVTKFMVVHYLNQTALGRAVVTATGLNTVKADPRAKTSRWVRANGKVVLDIPACDGTPTSQPALRPASAVGGASIAK